MRPSSIAPNPVVLQSCLTLCDPMDCSLPGSSVHGILQATILEWVAIPFSRALARHGVSREVPCSALKGETVLGSLDATPKVP